MPLVELPGFDQAVARHQWTGSRAIKLHTGRRACNRCSMGHLIRLDPVTQPALFYHGGYGAATETTIDVCLACGAVRTAAIKTRNPRRLS